LLLLSTTTTPTASTAKQQARFSKKCSTCMHRMPLLNHTSFESVEHIPVMHNNNSTALAFMFT
jgi:hypothetical protein